MIEYKTNYSTDIEILEHLKICNTQFVPKLSKRVNLNDYSKKLYKNSIRFEAWNLNNLVGLISVYFTDEINKIGFISNVSVVGVFMAKGIATRLLNEVKKYALINNFKFLKLEVNKNNTIAISFYKKSNFKIGYENLDYFEMIYKIEKKYAK